MDSTDKKIYFYRIFMKKAGNLVDSNIVFSAINLLPFSNQGRYLELKNKNAQCMFVEPIINPLRANIGLIRDKDLPMTEQNGITDFLNLPPGVRLIESTHFIVFPNNVIGAEYNYFGPRISCLKYYIPMKVPNLVDEVELVPLMRHDFMEQISKIGGIKKFRLKVHSDNISFIEKFNSNIFNMFKLAHKEAPDTEEVEITLNLSHGMNLSILDNLPIWLRNSDVLANLLVLKLHAKNKETERMEDFDLLQEYILSVKPVIKKDELHRSVDKISMYNAIESSYDELKSEINSAIGKGK